MGIPLTLVIIGISDQILTWERHSWVGWCSRAGFNTELSSWLLISVSVLQKCLDFSNLTQRPLLEVSFLCQMLNTDGFHQHTESSVRSLQVTGRARWCCNLGNIKMNIQVSA